MYSGTHFQIFSATKVLPKIFPFAGLGKNFWGMRIGRTFFKRERLPG
jgi:hypothetical protein